MDLRERLTALDESCQLFGQPIQQTHAAILVYDLLLEARKGQVEWICEIGTGYGTLSLYWALWARLHDVPFLTIDNGAASWAGWSPTPERESVLRSLGASVVEGDCFREGRDAVVNFIENGEGLLFCDGGRKSQEVATFAPMCNPETVIVAHDWPIEIDAERVAEIRSVEYLEPWNTQSLELGTRSTILTRRPVE